MCNGQTSHQIGAYTGVVSSSSCTAAFPHTCLLCHSAPPPWKCSPPSAPFSIQIFSPLQHSTRNRNGDRDLLPLSVFSKLSPGWAGNPFIATLWNAEARRPLAGTQVRTFTNGLVKEKEKNKASGLALQREEWKGRPSGLYRGEGEKGMREKGKQARNKQEKEGAHGTTQRKKESGRLKDSRNGDKGEQNQTSAATSDQWEDIWLCWAW